MDKTSLIIGLLFGLVIALLGYIFLGNRAQNPVVRERVIERVVTQPPAGQQPGTHQQAEQPVQETANRLQTSSSVQAAFTSPSPGEFIPTRREFDVSVQVRNFDDTSHYWVGLANIRDHEPTWNRVMELYQESRRSRTIPDELVTLINNWQIDQVWPKFMIKSGSYTGRVFEGGFNPVEDPQGMVLLILKVDDTQHTRIKQWFREGAAGKGYPGFQRNYFSAQQILAKCPIFLP